jgi:hypothetical protein
MKVDTETIGRRGDGCVLDDHTLGLSGRTGGEDDETGAVGANVRCHRFRRRGEAVQVVGIDDACLDAEILDRLDANGVDEDQLRLRVF